MSIDELCVMIKKDLEDTFGSDFNADKAIEIFRKELERNKQSKTCDNCGLECEPISLGEMCNHCMTDL